MTWTPPEGLTFPAEITRVDVVEGRLRVTVVTGQTWTRDYEPLAWTTTPPTEPGWHWYQHPDGPPLVVEVRVLEGAVYWALDCWNGGRVDREAPGTRWAGPLLPPEAVGPDRAP
jgi:hypothetical protein